MEGIAMRERLDTYLAIVADATAILESEATWEMKYNLIFSDEVSTRANALFTLDYYDPDTTYEEDVTAWVRAAEEKAEEVRIIREALP
jgi:hypothetical protein